MSVWSTGAMTPTGENRSTKVTLSTWAMARPLGPTWHPDYAFMQMYKYAARGESFWCKYRTTVHAVWGVTSVRYSNCRTTKLSATNTTTSLDCCTSLLRLKANEYEDKNHKISQTNGLARLFCNTLQPSLWNTQCRWATLTVKWSCRLLAKVTARTAGKSIETHTALNNRYHRNILLPLLPPQVLTSTLQGDPISILFKGRHWKKFHLWIPHNRGVYTVQCDEWWQQLDDTWHRESRRNWYWH